MDAALHPRAAARGIVTDGDVLLQATDMGVDASWGHIYGSVDLTVRADDCGLRSL